MNKCCLLLLLALAAGCKKNDPATEEIEATTQGRDISCGKAQVLVQDPAKVAQLLGSAAGGDTYLALNLDTTLWLHKKQALLLQIRRPTTEESSFLCNALGIVYPSFTVVSARVK